jgi:predicted amidohydrolase
MKLAAIQLDTIAMEVNHNVHKALGWCRQAFEAGAKYVFLHEGLTADYAPDPIRYGRSLDSHEVYGFCAMAGQYKGYIALGLNEVHQGRPYISCVFVSGKGVEAVYRKTYLWPNKKLGHEYIAYREGYRMERGVIAPGDGTKVVKVGRLRIGCIICADGSRKEAWDTFEKDRPDFIFYQNNRGNVAPHVKNSADRAKKLGVPMVITNRCGFSYHHFQLGGTCIIADDGSTVAAANEEGREEIVYAEYKDLHRLGSAQRK